jgi:hypothetical protein
VIYNREKLGEIVGKNQREEARRQIEFICGEVLI